MPACRLCADRGMITGILRRSLSILLALACATSLAGLALPQVADAQRKTRCGPTYAGRTRIDVWIQGRLPGHVNCARARRVIERFLATGASAGQPTTGWRCFTAGADLRPLLALCDLQRSHHDLVRAEVRAYQPGGRNIDP